MLLDDCDDDDDDNDDDDEGDGDGDGDCMYNLGCPVPWPSFPAFGEERGRRNGRQNCQSQDCQS